LEDFDFTAMLGRIWYTYITKCNIRREGEDAMIDENLLNNAKDNLAHMKNPVRLILFTRDAGCETCPEALALAKAIKARSPKIAFEVYDQVMDRDKAEQYGIKNVPSLVVQGGNGRMARFSGLIEDVFLLILLDTILSVSNGKVWFPDNILRALSHLEREVAIQVYVESDCPLCRPVAETAIGLAFESDLIVSDIIVASDFPDLIKKHAIKTLPRTIFGANLHMDGHVTESQFLEMIFQAEGVQVGPDKRCIVCGKPSPDIICTTCKNKIQAEAIDHKLKGEKLGQSGAR
jgi:thiol-disulfide isomerase/thioredoxin